MWANQQKKQLKDKSKANANNFYTDGSAAASPPPLQFLLEGNLKNNFGSAIAEDREAKHQTARQSKRFMERTSSTGAPGNNGNSPIQAFGMSGNFKAIADAVKDYISPHLNLRELTNRGQQNQEERTQPPVTLYDRGLQHQEEHLPGVQAHSGTVLLRVLPAEDEEARQKVLRLGLPEEEATHAEGED